MRWDETARSLGFAAVASALVFTFGIVSGFVFGPFVVALSGDHVLAAPGALDALAVVLVALYAARLAPGRGHHRRSRGLAAALFVIAAGVLAWLVGCSGLGVLASSAVALGVTRCVQQASGLGLRWHGVGAELGVLAGSLALSVWLETAFGHGVLGAAAGIWGFFLVQGMRQLPSPRLDPATGPSDPFERARHRLESLLDGDRSESTWS